MLIVEVNDLKVIDYVSTDGFLIGTDFISSECYKKFKKEEVIDFTNKAHKLNKIVFLDATQIFHDQDLEAVKTILKELNVVDYVLYNDLALMNFIEEKKRFYYSITYVTNKYDFEIISKTNKYTLISPTLSFEELKKFNNLENAFLIGFGTFEIFHSRRPLIGNYMSYRNSKYEEAEYQVIEEFRSEKYPIVEDRGTKIYLNDYYYLGEELFELNNNLILKVFNLSLEDTVSVVSRYTEALESRNFSLIEEIKELSINLHKGLLYENSILVKEVKTRG